MQSLFMLLFKSLNSCNVRIHVSNHQNMWLFVRGRVQFVKILKHLLKKEILHSLSVYQQNTNWNQNWLLKLSSISALFFLVEESVIKRINNNIDFNAFWIGSEICKTTRFYCLSILHSSQHPSVWVRLFFGGRPCNVTQTNWLCDFDPWSILLFIAMLL